MPGLLPPGSALPSRSWLPASRSAVRANDEDAFPAGPALGSLTQFPGTLRAETC
jgi:hypothetical protein